MHLWEREDSVLGTTRHVFTSKERLFAKGQEREG
jgi:hypothetical protein